MFSRVNSTKNRRRNRDTLDTSFTPFEPTLVWIRNRTSSFKKIPCLMTWTTFPTRNVHVSTILEGKKIKLQRLVDRSYLL